MKMSASLSDEESSTAFETISVSSEPSPKKKYEMMVIISSLITDEEIQQRLKGIKDLLGTEIVYEELWGFRPFAYPIKKQEKGYYAVWNFMSDTESIKELEEALKLYPDLLRYLAIKVPEEYKPIPLAEIEAGLEKLRKEKAEKRGQTKTASQRRGEKEKEKEKEKSDEKPAGEIKETKKPQPETGEPKPQAKAATSEDSTAKKEVEETAEKKEVKEEKPEKEKTLDEKLDAILSDKDLGL